MILIINIIDASFLDLFIWQEHLGMPYKLKISIVQLQGGISPETCAWLG